MHTIKPRMHYAVVLALVISNLTIFALGVLLSYSLLGGGLSYFAALEQEAKIEKAQAAECLEWGKCVYACLRDYAFHKDEPGALTAYNDCVENCDYNHPNCPVSQPINYPGSDDIFAPYGDPCEDWETCYEDCGEDLEGDQAKGIAGALTIWLDCTRLCDDVFPTCPDDSPVDSMSPGSGDTLKPK